MNDTFSPFKNARILRKGVLSVLELLIAFSRKFDVFLCIFRRYLRAWLPFVHPYRRVQSN